jgi:hypothetical protein
MREGNAPEARFVADHAGHGRSLRSCSSVPIEQSWLAESARAISRAMEPEKFPDYKVKAKCAVILDG